MKTLLESFGGQSYWEGLAVELTGVAIEVLLLLVAIPLLLRAVQKRRQRHWKLLGHHLLMGWIEETADLVLALSSTDFWEYAFGRASEDREWQIRIAGRYGNGHVGAKLVAAREVLDKVDQGTAVIRWYELARFKTRMERTIDRLLGTDSPLAVVDEWPVTASAYAILAGRVLRNPRASDADLVSNLRKLLDYVELVYKRHKGDIEEEGFLRYAEAQYGAGRADKRRLRTWWRRHGPQTA